MDFRLHILCAEREFYLQNIIDDRNRDENPRDSYTYKAEPLRKYKSKKKVHKKHTRHHCFRPEVGKAFLVYTACSLVFVPKATMSRSDRKPIQRVYLEINEFVVTFISRFRL